MEETNHNLLSPGHHDILLDKKRSGLTSKAKNVHLPEELARYQRTSTRQGRSLNIGLRQ